MTNKVALMLLRHAEKYAAGRALFLEQDMRTAAYEIDRLEKENNELRQSADDAWKLVPISNRREPY